MLLPRDVDEAIEALAAPGVHRILAGGTDEMIRVAHTARLSDGEVVISIGGIAALNGWTIDRDRGTLTLGAALPWSEMVLAPFIEWAPALAEAARTVGSPQIRNAGTLGGNVATASPAGDGLCAAVALDAIAIIRSVDGERRVPVFDLLVGPKRTSLARHELITAFEIPMANGYQGYAKVGVRNAMVISIAGACLVVDRASLSIRLALGSVGPTILRCPAAERQIADIVFGGNDTPEAIERAAASARICAHPIDDHRATADYRRHAVGVLTERLIRRAIQHEREGQ